MERFIRSLSIRKKDSPKNVEIGDSNKPQSWLEDQQKVKDSSCSYQVEYLGYLEVFDSRGIVVCEKAIKALKSSKSKCKKAVLYISGDAIRVVDEANKVLLVDQTLEKVSFCAPDRSIYEGFAYICRDAAAKRWLCHGFLANKDSGERISHALGCAFAVCLERKQTREKQKMIISTSHTPLSAIDKDKNRSGDSLFGNARPYFRQASLLERLNDPQVTMVTEPVPCKPAAKNKFEVKRPRPSNEFYKRQYSLQLTANVPPVVTGVNNNDHHNGATFPSAANDNTYSNVTLENYDWNCNSDVNSVDEFNGYNYDDNPGFPASRRQASFRPQMMTEAVKRQLEFLSVDNAQHMLGTFVLLDSADSIAYNTSQLSAVTAYSSSRLQTTVACDSPQRPDTAACSNSPQPGTTAVTTTPAATGAFSTIKEASFNNNSDRKLSDAECWLNGITESLVGCPSTGLVSGGSSLSFDKRQNFLSVSNPFRDYPSCGHTFFETQMSAPNGLTVGGPGDDVFHSDSDKYNPFL